MQTPSSSFCTSFVPVWSWLPPQDGPCLAMPGLAWSGQARRALETHGQAGPGLAWPGPAWPSIAWAGVAWPCLLGKARQGFTCGQRPNLVWPSCSMPDHAWFVRWTIMEPPQSPARCQKLCPGHVFDYPKSEPLTPRRCRSAGRRGQISIIFVSRAIPKALSHLYL